MGRFFVYKKEVWKMSIWIKTDKENVDWNEVADILDESQLSHYDPATEEKIFKNEAFHFFQ